jgi:hypothetical protein
MKRNVVIALVISLVFLALSFFLVPAFLSGLTAYYTSLVSGEVKVISTSVRDSFIGYSMTVTTFSLLPWVALFFSWLHSVFRPRSAHNYFPTYMIVVLFGYLAGIGMDFLVTRSLVKNVVNFKVAPGVSQSLMLRDLFFYKWAFASAIIAAMILLLASLFRKRIEKR